MSPKLILIVIFLVLVVIFPLIGRISGWGTLANAWPEGREKFGGNFSGK